MYGRLEGIIGNHGRTVRLLHLVIKDRVVDINVKDILNSLLTYGPETRSFTVREEKRIAVSEMKG